MGTTPRVESDKLVETYRSYAHALAADILRGLPPHVERAELEAAAELGLVEAAGAFEPRRGVQFKTFAYYRIRGAVYDCLRRMTWLSKSAYDQFRFEAAATSYMGDCAAGAEAGKAPDPDTVIGSMAACYLLSLDGLENSLASPEASAEENLVREQERERVRGALARLPEKNRVVLESYYYQGRSLEEIGRSLGLSKSWVSRLHAKSLELVRDLLAGQATLAPQAR